MQAMTNWVSSPSAKKLAKDAFWIVWLMTMAGAATALPIVLTTALCTVMTDLKILAIFGIILAAVAWLAAAQMDSTKATQFAIGFIVVLVIVFAVIAVAKATGWANTLSCISGF
jgi:hypothetical protein